MKVIIAGGRDVPHSMAVRLIVAALKESGWLNKIETIIEGGARGVDLAAKTFAKHMRWPVMTFEANWEEYGKSAGPIRNKQMAKECDALIAIWDGKSLGTRNIIESVNSLGKPAFVYNYGFNEEEAERFASDERLSEEEIDRIVKFTTTN